MAPDALLNYPVVLFIVSIVVLWGAAWIGTFYRRELETGQRDDFGIILGAALTLLALIIGFSFSMASARYDLRKTYEEAEANAIGTEYVRAELMPKATAYKLKLLLRSYTNARIEFYTPSDYSKIQDINNRTTTLQNQLWAAVRTPALANPTPVTALVVAGMNDVLNSQGFTQAAWWNRIPASAWWLMALIAICANVLVGFYSHRAKLQSITLLIVPILASVAFLLIADLDSPRGGLIHVVPQNLISLAQSFGPPR
jgi:hypothetical protein